ncbi:hypothetical protein EST38_g8267 [Candolleomyces aberdarensis]|uniref:Uncharacterized protein n=1 Tax=Candolleomyces aberdarensis TaxID=2316362 RepID=A0A4Q2DF85_9AGAR|nr:hypothetical protein EST38_g8267 [Candolleomyces aberdarensis]
MTPGDLSPFSGYLGTNDVPTAGVLKDLDEYLAGPAQDLQKVDAEIDEITHRLSALYSERATLTTRVQKPQGVCSLVRQLPDDILGEIFIRCLPSDRLPGLRFADAPLLLTTICRRWRDVATLTPRIWANLNVTTSPDEQKMERQLEDTRRFINRAGSLLLSLSVFESVSGRSKEVKKYSPLFQYILSLLPRTRLLHWKVSWGEGPEHLFRGLQAEAFSQLEEVRINWNWLRSRKEVDGIPPFLLGPNLRTVELSGGKLGVALPSALPSQWEQLTSLTIRNEYFNSIPGIQALTHLLQQCPNLRTCSVSLRGVEPHTVTDWDNPGPWVEYVATPDHTERTILLPFLHTFQVHYYGFVGDFIKRLHFPSIRELALADDHCQEVDMTYPAAALGAFVTYHDYCGSFIEKLEIQAKHYDYLIIAESLEKLKNLRHLVISVSDTGSTEEWDPTNLKRNRGFHQDLLVRMTPDVSSGCTSSPSPSDSDVSSLHPLLRPCLCPLLERFDYLESSNYLLNQQVLLTLEVVLAWVSAKWDASQKYPGLVSPLKHLTFPTRTSPDRKWKNALKPWREKGLVIEIAYPYLYEDPLKRTPQYQCADTWVI